MNKILVAFGCFFITFVSSLQPIGYQPLSIDQLISQSDYTILGKVISIAAAPNATAAGPLNTSSTAPTNASVATVQVLCNYIGNPPTVSASNINIEGLGTYTSDCMSYVGSPGWTGFFFLNHTVINTKLGLQNNGTSNSTADNSYQLGNHCQSPVVMSPTAIGTLWHTINDTSGVVGTGCLAANGFPLQSSGVGGPSGAGATISAAAGSTSPSGSSSAAISSSSVASAASRIGWSKVSFIIAFLGLLGAAWVNFST
ncbi:hypothetical protein NQZ79_g4640 [Umbelopsis isabellina]|nr:hypothetical protein NQZ79_g4640 [Umbelopsis isabellina]